MSFDLPTGHGATLGSYQTPGVDSLKVVSLPNAFLPKHIFREVDISTADIHLWPSRVMNKKGLVTSLGELSPPDSDEHNLLLRRLDVYNQVCNIKKAALPVLYQRFNTTCDNDCDCRHCSSTPPNQSLIIGPRTYIRYRSAFAFQKKGRHAKSMVNPHVQISGCSTRYTRIRHCLSRPSVDAGIGPLRSSHAFG